MPSSSACVTVLSTGQTYRFTGVLSVTHSLSLKISEKADATEEAGLVNGAKNAPDRVTLSVLETDAAHSAAGWAARMLDVLYAVKQGRLLCRVVTPHHTYSDMLLSSLEVTQDEEHPDGWSGEITFTGTTVQGNTAASSGGPPAAATKTDTNASIPKNVGSAAPPVTVTGQVKPASSGSSSAGTGSLLGMVSLVTGSTLEQAIARAGIGTDNIRYVK